MVMRPQTSCAPIHTNRQASFSCGRPFVPTDDSPRMHRMRGRRMSIASAKERCNALRG